MLHASLRPKAATVSKKKKKLFSPFPIQKPMSPNLTLALNGSRSTQGNNLNILGSACIDNATHKVSRSLVYWFWRRRFFKVFTIYGHCSHVGHVTQLICINFNSYSPSSFHMNFGYKSPHCFCEKQVLTL